MGETASRVNTTIKAEADKVLEKGHEIASEALETATAIASDVREVAKDRISEEFGKFNGPSSQENGVPRHH